MFNAYDNYVKLIQQNIKSLRKNFDVWLLKLQSLEIIPDIIVLTEVWIEDYEMNLFQIPGYCMYAKCNSLYRARGVVMYVTNNLVSRELDKINVRSADCIHVEVVLRNNLTYDLIGVYRLQEFSSQMFLKEFDNNCLQVVRNKNDRLRVGTSV